MHYALHSQQLTYVVNVDFSQNWYYREAKNLSKTGAMTELNEVVKVNW